MPCLLYVGWNPLSAWMLNRELSVESRQFEYNFDKARSQTKFLCGCQTVVPLKGGGALTMQCADRHEITLVE